MGNKTIIENIKYLYPNSDRPLWQIDLAVLDGEKVVCRHRLFVEPAELDRLLEQAKKE